MKQISNAMGDVYRLADIRLNERSERRKAELATSKPRASAMPEDTMMTDNPKQDARS